MMKWWLFGVLFLTSCVQVPLKPDSPNEHRPQVLSLWPQGEAIPSETDFFIWFSEEIDPTTLSQDSLWLIEGEVSPPDQGDFRGLKKSVEGGDLKKVSLQIEGVQGQGVHLRTVEILSALSSYTLVITPFILSEDRLPVFPHLQVYHTGSEGGTERSPESSPGSSLPSVDPFDNQASEEKETTPSSSAVVEGFIVINEILYDVAGSDTNGVLFIELYGTPFLDLGGFEILFINGDNGETTDSIMLPSGAKIGENGFYLIADAKNGLPSESFVEGADLIDEFDPQNGPEAVLFRGSDGSLVDSLGYGDLTTTSTGEGDRLFEGNAAPDVSQGHSIERKVPGVDTNNNRDDFVERIIPTPGYGS